jgi:hypothetical protein
VVLVVLLLLLAVGMGRLCGGSCRSGASGHQLMAQRIAGRSSYQFGCQMSRLFLQAGRFGGRDLGVYFFLLFFVNLPV